MVVVVGGQRDNQPRFLQSLSLVSVWCGNVSLSLYHCHWQCITSICSSIITINVVVAGVIYHHHHHCCDQSGVHSVSGAGMVKSCVWSLVSLCITAVPARLAGLTSSPRVGHHYHLWYHSNVMLIHCHSHVLIVQYNFNNNISISLMGPY